MSRSIPPRLRKPALMVLTGVLFAVAWLVRGGSLWWVSIPALITAGARAVAYYRLGDRDTDEDAVGDVAGGADPGPGAGQPARFPAQG
jgi:hypothetical protein